MHCAVNQAAGHLSRYFRARGNSDGDIARLHLRADVPLPGRKDAVRLELTAIATLQARHTVGAMLPQYAVTWAPEHNGPYPTFSGELKIESEDYASFDLVLEGRYEPPLGMVGAAFDAVVGHRIAESTARNLLATIADSIEAEFLAVESTKAEARKLAERMPTAEQRRNRRRSRTNPYRRRWLSFLRWACSSSSAGLLCSRS